MVTIRKRRNQDGVLFEIDDFPAYTQELRRRNLETPSVKYNIFVSRDTEQALRTVCQDLDTQVALFFRIGPTSGIDYRIVPA